eukprot:3433227-Pleurochrysis_carterae.AAC.2
MHDSRGINAEKGGKKAAQDLQRKMVWRQRKISMKMGVTCRKTSRQQVHARSAGTLGYGLRSTCLKLAQRRWRIIIRCRHSNIESLSQLVERGRARRPELRAQYSNRTSPHSARSDVKLRHACVTTDTLAACTVSDVYRTAVVHVRGDLKAEGLSVDRLEELVWEEVESAKIRVIRPALLVDWRKHEREVLERNGRNAERLARLGCGDFGAC